MTKIRLTYNEELKLKLHNKLKDYQKRNNDLDTFTKLTLLNNLLKNGVVDRNIQYELIIKTLPEEYQYKTPEQIYPFFENAWFVIDDYNKTGWINLDWWNL